MNTWYVHKKRLAVVAVLMLAALLMGWVWVMSVPGSARAQDARSEQAIAMLEYVRPSATLTPSLTAEKQASSNVIYDDGTIDFQIVLNNNTDSAIRDVIVRDVLDPRLEVLSASLPDWAGTVMTATDSVTYTVWNVPPTGVILDLRAGVRPSSFVLGKDITNVATISDGVNPLFSTNVVTLTMAERQAPSVQIDAPWPNQVIKQEMFTIRGRAWVGEQPFPAAPELMPISNSEGEHDWYRVRWNTVPRADAYILQESTDPGFAQFESYTVFSPTVQKEIVDQPRGMTYYYRVKVVDVDLYESRWSNVEEVTVNASALSYEPLGTARSNTSQMVATESPPTVQVRFQQVVDDDQMIPPSPTSWYTATVTPENDWWQWTYEWDVPEGHAQYTIEVRAIDKRGHHDPLNNEIITVTVQTEYHPGVYYVYLPIIARRYPPVPFAPTLSLDSNDGHGNYTLSWSYDHAGDNYPPTSYRFQEATDAGFTNVLIDETRTSPQSFASKAVGTYYYRVRGRNAHGEGGWSNVIEVNVAPRGYFDDFSNPNSGWPRGLVMRGEHPGVPDGPLFDRNYDSGTYRVKIMLDTLGFNNRRFGIVQTDHYPAHAFGNHYVVAVDHYFAVASDQGDVEPTSGKAGLIFGASSGYNTLYILEWNFEGQCSVVRYDNATHPVTTIDLGNYTYARNWTECPAKGGYNNTQRFRVVVRNNTAHVYIDNAHIGTYDMAGLNQHGKVGLLTGSWDRTPVESRFDNFRYAPAD